MEYPRAAMCAEFVAFIFNPVQMIESILSAIRNENDTSSLRTVEAPIDRLAQSDEQTIDRPCEGWVLVIVFCSEYKPYDCTSRLELFIVKLGKESKNLNF